MSALNFGYLESHTQFLVSTYFSILLNGAKSSLECAHDGYNTLLRFLLILAIESNCDDLRASINFGATELDVSRVEEHPKSSVFALSR